MPPRLRVGIIGLGRRWQRYRSVLGKLRQTLEVRATCDQIRHRADHVARELGCVAAAGPLELIERADVEALLVLDRQWFGLYPLELACRVGKPVFCALTLADDDAHADALRVQVRASGLPVLMALPAASAPATEALLAHRSGQPPSPVQLRFDFFSSVGGIFHCSLPTGLLQALFHVCAALVATEPTEATGTWNPTRKCASVRLVFPDGSLAQFAAWAGLAPFPTCRIQVQTPSGLIEARLSRRLAWRDNQGRHSLRTPPVALPERLLTRFVEAIRSGKPPSPSFEDAYRALTWLRAVRKSLAIDPAQPLDAPAADRVT
jgi:predicted dehydrogenase